MTTLDENWPPATPEREATRPRRIAKPILTADFMVMVQKKMEAKGKARVDEFEMGLGDNK